MKTTAIFTTIVVSVISMLLSTAPRAADAPITQTPAPARDAGAILRQMANTYASLSSYSDWGRVYSHGTNRSSAETNFRIYFVRSNHFRFEMTSHIGSPHLPKKLDVLWSNGREVGRWSQGDSDIRNYTNLVTAISAFTGVSSRSVHNIPSVLQTNWAWQERLDKITSPGILDDEICAGIDCYRIQGEGTGKRHFDVWIGKSDYLIRKIRTTYPNFSQEEIHHGIVINQQISPDIFTFIPPIFSEDPAVSQYRSVRSTGKRIGF